MQRFAAFPEYQACDCSAMYARGAQWARWGWVCDKLVAVPVAVAAAGAVVTGAAARGELRELDDLARVVGKLVARGDDVHAPVDVVEVVVRRRRDLLVVVADVAVEVVDPILVDVVDERRVV